MKSELSKRIKEAVKKAGGQKAVSTMTGIPLRTIANYTADISTPKVPALRVIAEAADVSLEWLATGEGEPSGFAASKEIAHMTQIRNTMESISEINSIQETAQKINARLLEEIVVMVDGYMGTEKIEPKRLARLYAMIYDYCIEDKAQGIDRDNVIRLLHLVS